VGRVSTATGSGDGQGLVEYGLMTALTSALTLLWLVVFGGTLSDALTAIGQAIDQAAGG
jgi:Flp pilus assembly pilin Flp